MESQGGEIASKKLAKNENNLKKKKTRGNMYTMLINTNWIEKKKNCTFSLHNSSSPIFSWFVSESPSALIFNYLFLSQCPLYSSRISDPFKPLFIYLICYFSILLIYLLHPIWHPLHQSYTARKNIT